MDKKQKKTQQHPKRTDMVLHSTCTYLDLQHMAGETVRGFEKIIRPMLRRLGMHNDAYIWRVLHYDNLRQIFLDAKEILGDKLALREDLAEAFDDDFWSPLRAPGCDVKNPRDPSFVFADSPLPLSCPKYNDMLFRCLSVKDCKIIIDEKAMRRESIVIPSEEDYELYCAAKDLCEKVNELNLKGRTLPELFTHNSDGKIVPKLDGIMFGSENFY